MIGQEWVILLEDLIDQSQRLCISEEDLINHIIIIFEIKVIYNLYKTSFNEFYSKNNY